MTDTDKDDLIFVAYYINRQQFKRRSHTVEAYARRANYKEVCHKLVTGEILHNTRLDIQGS